MMLVSKDLFLILFAVSFTGVWSYRTGVKWPAENTVDLGASSTRSSSLPQRSNQHHLRDIRIRGVSDLKRKRRHGHRHKHKHTDRVRMRLKMLASRSAFRLQSQPIVPHRTKNPAKYKHKMDGIIDKNTTELSHSYSGMISHMDRNNSVPYKRAHTSDADETKDNDFQQFNASSYITLSLEDDAPGNKQKLNEMYDVPSFKSTKILKHNQETLVNVTLLLSDQRNPALQDEPLVRNTPDSSLRYCYKITETLSKLKQHHNHLASSPYLSETKENIVVSQYRNQTVVIENDEQCQNNSHIRVGSTPTILNVTAVTCCIRWCTHQVQIEADSSYNMVLNFHYFNVPGLNLARIEDHDLCEEALEISVEDTSKAPGKPESLIIGSFCGIKTPTVEVIEFSKFVLALKLQDNRQCQDTMGFVVEIIPCLKFSSEFCDSKEFVRFHSEEGYISSPGLASAQNYPRGMNCQWNVSVSHGKLIHFTPDILRLSREDVLEIYPDIESSREFPNVLYYSDSSFRQPVVLPGSSCVVRFQSNSAYAGEGFNISYRAVEASSFIPMLSNTRLDCSSINKIPSYLICDLHEDCAGGEDENQCAYRHRSCWPRGYFWGGHCYQIILFQRDFSWTMAEQYCERNLDSYLLTINKVDERMFVDSLRHVLVHKLNSMFIGLQRMRIKQVRQVYRRMWQWVDGTTAFYLPNEYRYDEWEICSMMLLNSFLAIDCSAVKKNVSFICERPTESNKISLADINHIAPKQKSPMDKIKTFLCKHSKEYISEDQLCNGIDNCFDRSDEADCESSANNEEMFICDSGELLAYSFVCDGVDNCLDDSDETFCKIPDKSSVGLSNAVCTDGMVIPRSLLCDAKEDCLDASDEEDCTDCVTGSTLCPMIACLPQKWEEDDEVDCPHGMRLPELLFKENIFRNIPPPGIVLPDGYGKFEIQPLSFHGEPCPETHRACVDGYCIPVYMWCNGMRDCPHQEDENEEVCRRVCEGMYRCKHSRVCLHPDHLCDGFYQCPRHDDEMLCGFQNLSCPKGCFCVRMEVTCFIEPVFEPWTPVRSLRIVNVYLPTLVLSQVAPYSLVNLNVSGCYIKNVTRKNLTFVNLRSLDLSHNAIEYLARETFKSCPVLKSLSLAHNNMNNATFSFLDNTRELVRLDLSFNTKQELEQFCFYGAFNLEELILRYMNIMRIHEHAFHGLLGLKRLDLQGNKIIHFTSKVFSKQQNLQRLVTDNFRLCCPNVKPSKLALSSCEAPFDEISSCEDILGNIIIRSFLWIAAVLTILGNVGVIIFRVFLDKDVKTSFRIIITCLSVSDLMMGVYLIIIGSADIAYRDRYILAESQWKNSVYCQMAGFLCLFSSETSALFILLVTVDRVLAICFPFLRHLHFNGRSASLACGFVWMIGLTMAAVPLLPPFHHWNLYSQKAVGVPLPITRDTFPGYGYAFSIFILFNIVVFLLVAIGQVVLYVFIRTQEVPKEWCRHVSQDAAIAKRLSLIVLTDCLCWFPITVMGLAARAGRPVPGEMYVVATVLLLPINSAFNPFLYTLHAMVVARQARRKRHKHKRLQPMQTTSQS